MMHLTPDLVLPLSEAGDGKEKKSRRSGIREGWAWAERRWTEVTEDTGIGNPEKATKEKGARFFADVTDKVSQLMNELCEVDKHDLYN